MLRRAFFIMMLFETIRCTAQQQQQQSTLLEQVSSNPTYTSTEVYRMLYAKTGIDVVLYNYFIVNNHTYSGFIFDSDGSWYHRHVPLTTWSNRTEYERELHAKYYYQRWKRVLREVASWLMEHKYVDINREHFNQFAPDASGRAMQRTMFRQFATPEQLHEDAREACQRGFLYCLKVAHEKVTLQAQVMRNVLQASGNNRLNQWKELIPQGSNPNKYAESFFYNKTQFGHIIGESRQKTARAGYEQIMQNEELRSRYTRFLDIDTGRHRMCQERQDRGLLDLTSAPFGTFYEQFQFRATISFYMCWYTIAQYKQYATQFIDDRIEQFFTLGAMGDKERSIHAGTCALLGACQFRMHDAFSATAYVHDKRVQQFSCAFQAFCPDFCCGAAEYNPLYKTDDYDKCAKAEPDVYACAKADVRVGCHLQFNHIKSVGDLLRQENWKPRCRCQPGRRWDLRYYRCVDDESICSLDDSSPMANNNKSSACKGEHEVCIARAAKLKQNLGQLYLTNKRTTNYLHKQQIAVPVCVCAWGYRRGGGGGGANSSACVHDVSHEQMFRDVLIGELVTAADSGGNNGTNVTDSSVLDKVLTPLFGRAARPAGEIRLVVVALLVIAGCW